MYQENKNTVRPRGTDSARVIQVVETRALAGSGTLEDPVYEAVQYWSTEGKFLAERKPHFRDIAPASSSSGVG